MKPIGFIYKTTNLVNGKIYIGQHEIKDFKFNDLYIGSGGMKFRNSVKKYGRKNFKRKILKLCYTINQLNGYETYFIKKFNATDPNIGYNLLPGPPNLLNPSKLPHVKEIKSKKFTGSGNPMFGIKGENHHLFGTKLSEERRNKLRGKNNPMFGKVSPFKNKHHSNESKRILSEKMKKRFSMKENHPMYGKQLSDDTKKKISEKNKGENNYWFGKKHSVETINKMKQSSYNGKRSGSNNGAYGRIWITNGIENKFVNSDKIPNGWRRGRTI